MIGIRMEVCSMLYVYDHIKYDMLSNNELLIIDYNQVYLMNVYILPPR